VGAGKKLLELALKEGSKHEYPIRVEVFDWNKGAIEFYKRNGFNMDSVVLNFTPRD
jgi:ribosomal protein S18 acetylase RimI-like enzyme